MCSRIIVGAGAGRLFLERCRHSSSYVSWHLHLPHLITLTSSVAFNIKHGAGKTEVWGRKLWGFQGWLLVNYDNCIVRVRWMITRYPRVLECLTIVVMTNMGECVMMETGRTRQLMDMGPWSGKMETSEGFFAEKWL